MKRLLESVWKTSLRTLSFDGSVSEATRTVITSEIPIATPASA